MLDHIATLSFVHLDEFHKAQTALNSENDLWLKLAKNRRKDRKLTLPEAACLLMLFQASGCRDFNKFLELGRPRLALLFPNLPSYSNLLKAFKRAELFLRDFLQTLLVAPGGRDSVYALDSTKIDSHKAKHWPKCLRREARAGWTHEGLFFGFKLHVLCNRKGEIVAIDLTPGNAHDLDPVKRGMLAKIKGICFADSGYVSGQIRQDLTRQDLAFIAKPTEAMIDERWLFDRIWAKKYRSRQVVEGVFSVLKRSYGLLACSVRSAAALRARVWASLAAYCLRKQAA